MDPTKLPCILVIIIYSLPMWYIVILQSYLPAVRWQGKPGDKKLGTTRTTSLYANRTGKLAANRQTCNFIPLNLILRTIQAQTSQSFYLRILGQGKVPMDFGFGFRFNQETMSFRKHLRYLGSGIHLSVRWGRLFWSLLMASYDNLKPYETRISCFGARFWFQNWGNAAHLW